MYHSEILICIPARYASTRLNAKPLQKIAGVEMVKRVADIAAHVCRHNPDCHYLVATDDERILTFCHQHDIPVAMTAENCKSGTERCWNAVSQLEKHPELVINLQGDNPLCPPWFLEQLIQAWQKDRESQLFTPFLHLSWAEYDAFKDAKKTTPFSGTSVLIDKQGYALAFSKMIIPAIRKEEKLRQELEKSPVRRHIGLYAYTYNALKNYFEISPSPYEEPEGLEQMRFLHHRIPVKMVEVDYRGRKSMSGVDSPEDIARAEAIIAEYGEFDFK
jgi:3-deoxy-manno-octulosonate cytidylyltransferase (CMP-KDO synthetase)